MTGALGLYILDGHEPVPVDDPVEWGKIFEKPDGRRVAEDVLGEVRVSTVFLGIDHAFFGGPPILFETMIFGGPLDGEQERCSTWDQAEAMHARVVGLVRGGMH